MSRVSAIDRAIAQLEEKKREAEARVQSYQTAINALRSEVVARITKARKPKGEAA